MWKTINTNTIRGISVKSLKCKYNQENQNTPNRSAIINQEYSLGIFFSSCESRGLVASQLLKEKACTNSIFVTFNSKDNSGLRATYDPILKQQIKRCTNNQLIDVNEFSEK